MARDQARGAARSGCKHETEIELAISVTLGHRLGVPLHRCGIVLRHATAVFLQDAKLILRSGVPLLRQGQPIAQHDGVVTAPTPNGAA